MVAGPLLCEEYIGVLRRSPIIATLGEQSLMALVPTCHLVSFSPNYELFVRGSPATHIYVVLEGWVQLSRDQCDGTRAVIHLFGPGDSFGEALLATGATYPVSAEAASSGRCLAIPTLEIRDRITVSPDIAIAAISANCRHLRQLVDHIEQVTTWPARRRVAEFLLRLCPPGSSGCRIVMPIEQRLIAARLNMTPSTFSRTLRSLGGDGVVAARGEIVVKSVATLARAAAS